MYGSMFTTPFIVSIDGTADDWGYSNEQIDIVEFEGVIDYVKGNRYSAGGNTYNNYMTVHEDTTHIIITEYDPDIYDLLMDNKRAHIRDGYDNIYTVLLVDNVAYQNHHLEIEVEMTIAKSRDAL